MSEQIITSLLDTDQYKLTMMQFVFHNYKNSVVEYEFFARENNTLGKYQDEIITQVRNLEKISISSKEYDYLCSLDYFKKDFLSYLKNYKFNANLVKIEDVEGKLIIKIKGTWLETILFEVPLLSIVNEIHYKYTAIKSIDYKKGINNLERNLSLIKDKNFKFCDFGTRRRYSKEWQSKVIKICKANAAKNFIGTSNLYYAMKFNLKPLGTMAHEYLQAFQSISANLADSQKEALRAWLTEYDDKLAIALTDVINLKAFLKDFSEDLPDRYKGVRHDSGCPYAFGEKIIKHYKNLGIDPLSKIIIYSNSLNMESALKLYNNFKDRIQLVFGIGTNLTNDVGLKQLKIVVKMISCNSTPVLKITDDNSKSIINDINALSRLKSAFKLV